MREPEYIYEDDIFDFIEDFSHDLDEYWAAREALRERDRSFAWTERGANTGG